MLVKIIKLGGGGSIQKEIQRLKQTLNQTTQNNKQIEGALKQKYIELENVLFLIQLNSQIDAAKDAYNRIESDLNDQMIKISDAKLEKLLNVFRISTMQIKAKKFEDICNNTGRLTYPESQLKK